MTSQTSSSSSGIGFFGLLGIVFITLKLLGYVAWSWWWVTAPLWGPALLVVLGLAGYALYLGFLVAKSGK
jgi:hypothetical protein